MASRNLGSLTIDLIARTFGFEQGMDKAARTAAKRSKEIQSSITGSFKVIGASIAGFVAGLALVDTAIRGLNEAIDSADKLDELSNRFGISTEQLSAWGYAAKLTGSDLESLTGAIPKFSKVIADAADSTSQSAKIFDALGISVKDQAGNLRTFQDLLPEVADRFKGITDQTLKTSLALQLFGKSGAQFLEFLSLGSDGLAQMADKAKDLGVVISSDTAAAAAAFNDRVDDLKAATQGLFTNIAAQLLPALTKTTQEFTALVKNGDLAANAVTLISTVLSAGVGIVNTYNRAVYGLTLQFEVAAKSATALATANAAFVTQGGAAGIAASINAFKEIKGASDEATASWQRYNKAQQEAAAKAASPFAGVTSRTLGAGDYQALERQAKAADAAANAQGRLQALLSDPTGGAKAKQAAEDLTKQYQSLVDSMEEQIALFGETTKEAKIRYDLENTELAKLTQAQKDNLITLAQQADAQELLNDLQKAADAEVKKQGEDRRRQLEDADTQIQQMQQELDLLGMTNKERRVAIELSHLGAEATDEQRQAVADLARAYEDQMEQIAVMDDLRDSFKDFFSDVLSGNKSLKDSFKDLFDSIQDMILKRIAQNWVDQLFGQQGSSSTGSAGGWGQWFSTIAGLFSGGKANGGWADSNSLYEVNERGFEMANIRGRQYMLTGDSPVRVTPNHALADGSGVNQSNTFVIQGDVDRRTQSQIAQNVGRRTQVAMSRNG